MGKSSDNFKMAKGRMNAGEVYEVEVLIGEEPGRTYVGYIDTTPDLIEGELENFEEDTIERLAEVLAKSKSLIDIFTNSKETLIERADIPGRTVVVKKPLSEEDFYLLAKEYAKRLPPQ